MMSLRNKISESRVNVRKDAPTRLRSANILHVVFNIILVVLVYFLTVSWNLTLLAVTLVILSKWRIIAVRPRFWWANFRANLPDMIVGFSTVAWLATAADEPVRFLVTILYLVWLLFIKPRTSELGMMMQAGWSEFIGVNTIFIILATNHASWSLLLVWLVTWSNARHFLGIFDDESTPLLSVVWASVVTQLGWLCLQWLVLFRLPGGILIAQFALLISVISYGLGGWYSVAQDDDNDMDVKSLWVRYGIFTVGALAFILLFTPWSGGI